MNNLDKLIGIFDDWSDSMLNKHGHLIDKAGDLLEDGLDKAIGVGFNAVEKIQERRRQNAKIAEDGK